ncbi:hypothetical protein TrLO_g1467 [Triparma laevis f. longispina]|nr:hypothetical protein TrLO_g1467 [Triparma laevis f. longispina]
MADLPARIKQMKKLHGDAIGSDSPFNAQTLQHSLNNPNQENWKNFEKGSEAGRLMAKLYGGAYKPQISYPTLKTKKAVNNGAWQPSNKGNAVVSKFDKKKANKVAAPKFRQTSNYTFAPVDFIPKKRNADACQTMIVDAEMRQSAYRPPHMNAFSGDDEKQRLSEVFTHKGGKALPKDLTHPVGPAPYEVRQRQAEQQRVLEAKAARRTRLNGGVDPLYVEPAAAAPERSAKDQLFDQIYDEIKDRRAYQEEMELAGAGKANRQKVAAEISSRLSKLSSIDKGRAAEVMIEMYQ